jgi:hypothetical protein
MTVVYKTSRWPRVVAWALFMVWHGTVYDIVVLVIGMTWDCYGHGMVLFTVNSDLGH